MKIPPRIRSAVLERDAGRCVRCGEVGGSIHHRVPRRMGGTKDIRSYDMRNLVTLCGSGTTGCHGWVESNRALAYLGGWLVNGYVHLDDILTRPDGRAVLLGADGSRNDLGESA